MAETGGKGITSIPSVRLLLSLLYGIPIAGILNTMSSIVWVLHSAPPGTAIRPMGLAVYLFLVEVFTLLSGGILSIVTIIRWRKEPVLWLNAVAALALSVTPLWLGVYFFRWFAAYRGLVLSD